MKASRSICNPHEDTSRKKIVMAFRFGIAATESIQ